jgi:hypothetical protein
VTIKTHMGGDSAIFYFEEAEGSHSHKPDDAAFRKEGNAHSVMRGGVCAKIKGYIALQNV